MIISISTIINTIILAPRAGQPEANPRVLRGVRRCPGGLRNTKCQSNNNNSNNNSKQSSSNSTSNSKLRSNSKSTATTNHDDDSNDDNSSNAQY